MAYILGFLQSLRDVALAAYDIVTRRSRRRYTYQAVITAPKVTVRSLIIGTDVTFAKANLRCVEEPLPGVEGAVVARTFVGGEAKNAVAWRRIEDTEDSAVVQYLPEHSESAATIGTNDVFGVAFEALPCGSTRLRLYRELTHRRPATRITTPLGLRVLAWLVKTEAEAREGTAPGTVRRWLTQAAWLVAALASFWWLAGWKDAVLLVVLIVLHEAGHALAMCIAGRGVRVITLIPFIGGMAVPKRMYESDAQHVFVALMGPGMSLLPTLGLIWFAYSNESQLAAHAGFMFAFINGINLLPMTPLDGGVAVNALLHAIHRLLAQAIAWLSTLAGLALAFYLQSVLIGIVFVFAGLQLIHQASLDMHLKRRRLRWFQAPVVLVALVLTCGAYVMAIMHGSNLEYTFALLAPPEANASGAGDEEPSHCWMPTTSGQALEAYLDTQLQIDDWRATPRILAAAEIAGQGGAVERWLTQNAARKLETQISSGTVADLGEALRLTRTGSVEEIRALLARNSKDDAAANQFVIHLLVLNGRYGEAATLVTASPDKVTKPALIRELLRAGAWERAVAFHESQDLSGEMLQVIGEIANSMSKMNRMAEARSFLQRLTARARQAQESGASSFWPPEALYWLVRLGATDIALPADDKTTEPWELARAVAFRAAQLEDTGDTAGAQALLASFAKASAENFAGVAKTETSPFVMGMIEDELAPARAIVKLERGGLSVAEAFASSDVDYEEEVPLRAEYLRQGRFSDAEAYDLRLKPKPTGPQALRAILVPPPFDAAATPRYMEFAFAAAKRGDFETASQFAARAGRILCYAHPKVQNGGLWRAWFTRNIFVLKAAGEGRLAPAVLNHF
jgi:Zn-dependent protease